MFSRMINDVRALISSKNQQLGQVQAAEKSQDQAFFRLFLCYTSCMNSPIPSSNRKGFTLAEAITVVTIMGVLAALAIPRFNIVVSKMRNQEAIQILSALYEPQVSHFKETGSYASSIGSLDVELNKTPDNFETPVLYSSTTIQCDANPSRTTLASMRNKGATYGTVYFLHLLDDGSIGCVPCTSDRCVQMGFAQF